MKRKWFKRTASFLVACVVAITALSCGLGFVSALDDEHDLGKFITGVTLWVDGNEYDPDTSAGVKPSSELHFKVDFAEINKDESEGGLQFPTNGTITYQIPADLGILNIKAESGVLKNNNDDEFGDEVGTYEIDENGFVTIQFKEGYTDAYRNITADFYFTATISDEFDDTNETSIRFNDDVAIDVKFDHSSGLDVSKKISSYDKETKTITYEIVAENRQGTVKDVVITDIMENNLKLVGDVPDAFEVNADPGNGSNPTVSISESDDTGWDVYPYNKYLISIDEMGPGSSVKLTYKATVSEDAFINAGSDGSLQWVNNKISAAATDPGNNDQTVTVYEKTVYFNEETYYWNSKSGELSDDQKSATWTFMVNKSAGFSVDGNTAADTLKSSALSYDKTTPIVLNKYDADGELVSTDEIKWDDENLTVTDTSFSYKFPEGSGAYAYEFVYKTDIDNSGIIGSDTLSNEGTYTGGGQGTSDGVSVEGDLDASLNKESTSTGDNWNTLGWKITATVKNGNTDLKYYIEDTIENAWVDGIVSDKLDVDSFKVTINGSEAVNGTDYTLVYDEANNTFGVYFNSENKDGSYLKASDEEYAIVIEYNTIVNDAFKKDNVSLTNNVKANVGGIKDFNASAYARIMNSEINVHKKVRSQSDTGLKAEYEITINSWEYGDTTDAKKQLSTAPLVIDDVFDAEKFELDTDSPVSIQHGENYYSDWDLKTTDDVTITSEPLVVDGKTVGIRFTTSDIPQEYTNRIFVIRYTLKLKDEYINAGNVSMPNTATVTQGSASLGSDEVSCEYNPVFLSKAYTSQAAEWNGYKGTFTLDVNKLKANISDDDVIVVKDQLDGSMTLDLDSIKVLDEENSEVENTISYDADTKLLSITVPDETYVKIVYDVVFRGNSGTTQSFTNSAWIEGLASSKTEVNDSVQFASQESGGSAGGSIPSFSILKYDESDTTKKLENAVFGLYKTNGTLVMTQTTGGDGIAEFKSADFTDGDYYLQEITAPNGYALDPTKHYFSLNCDSENGYRKVFYKDTINITNRKTQFTVNKVDEEENGVSGATLEIVNSDGETVYTYKTDGNPITVGNLSNGKYTLKETKAPEGYEVADSIEFELVDGKLVSGNGIDTDSQIITMIDRIEETTEATTEVTTEEETTEATTEVTTEEETTEAPTEVKYNPSLKKIVDGTETDAEFTFVVAPSDNKLDSAATITLKNGETKEIEGLVDGTEYVIYEVGANGYDVAFENGNSEYVFTYDSSAEGLVFTATNTEYKGIKLKKTVVENGIVQIADENVTFDFDIVAADGNVVKSVKVSQGEEISIDGKDFKNGAVYTLVEKTQSKYELTVKVNGEEVSSDSFVYSKDSVAELEAVNAYTEQPTETTAEETTEAPTEETTEATTEVTTEATTEVTTEEETTETTTEVTTEVTTEATTEVTTEEETTEAPTEATTEATTETTTEVTTEVTTEATTEVTTEEETTEATIEEETTEETTEVKYNPSLKKIVDGTETDAEFTFVVAPSGNKLESAATITLKNGETKEIEGLVDGTEYVIYEVGANGYDVAFENGNSEYVFTYDSSAEGLVFTATNTEYKGIKLKKTVVENGIVQIADENVTFDFDIVAADGNVVKSVKVSQGEEISIDGKDFKNGAVYTLVEKTQSKYELTVKVNGEEVSSNSFEYSKDSVAELEAVNAYTEQPTETTAEETTEAPTEEITEATTEVTTEEETTEASTEATTEETTETTTEVTTEVTTEATTEVTTEEETTEAPTEATTEETTETTTEVTTEVTTEAATEVTTEEETTEAPTEATTEATTEKTTEATTEGTTETTTAVTTEITAESTTESQTEPTSESDRDKLVRYLNENLNENDYTPESWKVYKEVLERAKLVLAAGDENQIKAILVELEEARRKLVLGVSVNTGVAAEVSLGVFAIVGIIGTAAIFKRKRDDE